MCNSKFKSIESKNDLKITLVFDQQFTTWNHK
jgi:hypothetical protein